MSSGYFPLKRDDEDAKALLKAARVVRHIAREYEVDGLNADEALYDGGSLAMLNLAADLIEGQIEKPKENENRTMPDRYDWCQACPSKNHCMTQCENP
jgi:hypothetical protein